MTTTAVIVSLAITVTLAATMKHVTVVIDGTEQKIATFKGTFKEVLESKGIEIHPEDKLSENIENKLKRNSVLSIKSAVPVTIVDDSKTIKVNSAEETVQSLLESQSITLSPNDKVSVDQQTKVEKDMTVSIKRAVPVKILVDASEINLQSADDTVGDLLKSQNISLGDKDKINHNLDEKLMPELAIEIVRVKSEIVTEVKSIGFNTQTKKDSSKTSSQSYVEKEGVDGQKEVKLEVTYENGKEVSRNEISSTVVKEPQDKIFVQGTQTTPVYNRGEHVPTNMPPVKWSAVFNTTAYSPTNGATRAWTYSGMQAVRNSNGWSTVAVDPSVIPIGTKLFVEGYGFAIAADTGSAIKGNKVDVFFNSYEEACAWGRRFLNVYVLD